MDSVNSESPAIGAPVLRRMIAQREKLRGPALQTALALRDAAHVSTERAAATALGRAAERLHRLPVFVEKAEFGPVSLSELSELLPERALLAVLEGGRDMLGVMAICPALLTSLIEMQALGRVTSRPPVPRRATRTDAAITADLVNGFLAELTRELGGRPDMPDFGQFRYATYLDDPRPLGLMLDDVEMTRLVLKFRIGGGGQRDGLILLALPATHLAKTRPASGQMQITAETPQQSPPAPTLAIAMQQAPVRVVGVLCRRTLSLRTLRGLVPGAVIPLPQNALDDARIETTAGQLLARGRLGEAEGMHAIRLRASAEPKATPTDAVPIADLDQPDAFRSAPDAGQATRHAPPEQARSHG
ncbi:FliM/FliN family flagellar motor C-terminal domain-containing protein [Paracoccus laeviglucosivorans]|nr:flagellar motor switch protein FliM [Paracoccus laeviglucosivorans]